MEEIKDPPATAVHAFSLPSTLAKAPWLGLFVFTIPFSYALQVIFFNRFAGLLPYLFLCAHLSACIPGVKSYFFSGLKDMCANPVTWFALFILYAVAVELAATGPVSAGRLATIYLLPISLYWIFSGDEAGSRGRTALALLAISAAGVALAELYEFAMIRPTAYEARHFLYVKEISGLELGKWQGATRPGGILDHIHASATYIGAGLLASFLHFSASGKRWALVSMALCATGLVASGMRLPVAACLFAFAVSLPFVFFWPGRSPRRAALALAVAALSVTLFASATRHRAAFWDFYSGPARTGTLTPGISFSRDIALPQLKTIAAANNRNPATALFGYGFMTTRAINANVMTDDFVIAQLYGNLGALGLASFLSLFAFGAALFYGQISGLRSGARPEALFSAMLLLALFLSLFHSGVVIRRQIYPLLFIALGILSNVRKAAAGD